MLLLWWKGIDDLLITRLKNSSSQSLRSLTVFLNLYLLPMGGACNPMSSDQSKWAPFIIHDSNKRTSCNYLTESRCWLAVQSKFFWFHSYLNIYKWIFKFIKQQEENKSLDVSEIWLYAWRIVCLTSRIPWKESHFP